MTEDEFCWKMEKIPQNISSVKERSRQNTSPFVKLTQTHNYNCTLKGFFFSSMTAFKKCFHSMKRKAHRSVTGIFPCWQSKGRKATDRRNTSGLLSSFQLRPSPQPILFSGTENGINYNNKHSILQGIITEGSNFSCAHQL